MNTNMNIQVVEWAETTEDERRNLLSRPAQFRDPEFSSRVTRIIEAVKEEKDDALLRFSAEFDRVQLETIRVTLDEIQDAYTQISTDTLSAFREAIRRITLFHKAQLPTPIDLETSRGVRCERRFFPIKRVGLYVPGGTAPLPSTVMMLGIPSGIAGCPTRVLVTPPRRDQSIDPSILVVADLLGIQQIYKMGGAQAIAALAYGTESIPKVDKIYGPGNSWVTEAKLQVSQDPSGAACDLPAGPSEVMVIADWFANPDFVAADLLSQAEHGVDSQVILISNSKLLIDRVQTSLEQQLEVLPRREIAAQALRNSLLIEVPEIRDSIQICNEYAPEHLILQLQDARKFAEFIENAGSVFLGPWTPESMGDYASGTNHVLPTYGYARSMSGLNTESFMKSITFQELSLAGLDELGPTVMELARTEGLDAHRNAVQVRLQQRDVSKYGL